MTKQLMEFIEPLGTFLTKLCIMNYALCIKRNSVTWSLGDLMTYNNHRFHDLQFRIS